jgi:tRNA threonylcarbamoyladenosine biosynthesis protein TsaB
MNILAIDTSSREGAVCLSSDGDVLGVKRFGRRDSHLVALGGAVDSLLAENRLSIENVNRIAVVSGPGSFTGMRIGMAFVKGMYAALGCDVVTMNGLELLVHALFEHGRLVCPMIDARKNEVYAALYRPQAEFGGRGCEPILEPRVQSASDLLSEIERMVREPVLFTGSGVRCYRELIDSFGGIRKSFAGEEADAVSLPVFSRLAAALTPLSKEEMLALEPFYIRSSDAELKRLKSHKTHEGN